MSTHDDTCIWKGLRIKPYYPIKKVKEAVKNGFYRIEDDAWKEMWDDLRWKTKDIENFFSKLTVNHWRKSDKMKRKIPRNYSGPLPIILDIYHARNINGQDVYTHLYFEEDFLVIDSLHGLD